MKPPAHKPPSSGQVAMLRAKLLVARRRVVGQLGRVEESLRAIGDLRESELGERSQVLAEADIFARLGDEEFAILSRIEGALHRIASGSYGSCSRCSTPIAIGRLRADPSAALCSGCAGTGEGDHRVAAATEAAPQESAEKSILPPDLLALDDAEIAALVRERFREEVGEALGGVRVVCRRAVVILAGEVASDDLRQVAQRIVEDEMGLDISDRMRVTSADSEGEASKGLAPGPGMAFDELCVDITDGDGISQDIFSVEEDGLPYNPPARPVAD